MYLHLHVVFNNKYMLYIRRPGLLVLWLYRCADCELKQDDDDAGKIELILVLVMTDEKCAKSERHKINGEHFNPKN